MCCVTKSLLMKNDIDNCTYVHILYMHIYIYIKEVYTAPKKHHIEPSKIRILFSQSQFVYPT